MIGQDELEYEQLEVQPGRFTVGELTWEYEFNIEIEVSTGFLQTYVVFVSLALENSAHEFEHLTEFRDQFEHGLINAEVPYAFEDSNETNSVALSFEVIQKAILEFRSAAEDQLFLQMGETFIDILSRKYEEEVGFKPDERIPGPSVPSIYQALCPVCQSSLDVHLNEDQNHLYCASCDSVRDNPRDWGWLTPEADPEYSGELPDEQPDPDEAGCPNCGSRLAIYKNDLVGHCPDCRGIWRRGTWHEFDLVHPEEAACPDCGSRLSGVERGGSGVCESCDSVFKRRNWSEYDPVFDSHEFPFEVKPGVLQVSERKYKVKSTDHFVDSLWEADLDQRLEKRVPEHQREPGPFKISKGYYTPDFRVEDVIIEVKGIHHEDMLDDAISKADDFRERNPDLTYVVVGGDQTEKIPCDKWFEYPAERSKAVKWVAGR